MLYNNNPNIEFSSDDNLPEVHLGDGQKLDVLPLRNMVMFPGVLASISLARTKSQKLVKKAFESEHSIAVLTQRDEKTQDPSGEDLYNLGTAARIIRIFSMPDNSSMVILEGLARIECSEFEQTSSKGLRAKIEIKEETFPRRNDKEFLSLAIQIKQKSLMLLSKAETPMQEASMTLRNIDNPITLINYICVNFGMTINQKIKLLTETNLAERAKLVLEELVLQLKYMDTRDEIQAQTKTEIDKEQREYYLHHQLEAIRKELGDDTEQIIKEMREKAKEKHWPEAVAKVFEEELKKLERTSPHSPDYSTQENYLTTILELPWDDVTENNFDIDHARQVLDDDHYGIEKVKERIIEYLAVLKLRQGQRFNAPILCLYGPPGVGKTSLGKSIASALGRKYARISLGGLHDEAEIRGHRRTYIGAMPGRIIENLRKTKSSNPVFVLDEIDKIGADYKGDPTSALLEVLDPEQNNTFHDNYLDIDYDLSRVLFIATANTLDSIPRPLLDRMELIEMTGYLAEEKIEIAKNHLLPKELEKHGIKPSQLRLKKDIIARIIEDYTRESGVRALEREIGALCRKIVTKIALSEEYNTSLTPEDLTTYLGRKRFYREEWETNKYAGVVTGLAWTQVGGEILFIETSLSTSKTPTLTLTGNLGDVMKESATIALGYIKAHAAQFGIKQKDLDTKSVHIHVPEGATPKDGPSAGITMTTALVSAFTGRLVRPRIAMTGEMTLRGKVLPIGGVKEKILAAKRAGITDLILCQDNQKDVEDIPNQYLKGLRFHYVKDIQEVINFALEAK